MEQEKRERRKQKEKERKERLKKEGKLLTKSQREARARAEATLKLLQAQGEWFSSLAVPFGSVSHMVVSSHCSEDLNRIRKVSVKMSKTMSDIILWFRKA